MLNIEETQQMPRSKNLQDALRAYSGLQDGETTTIDFRVEVCIRKEEDTKDAQPAFVQALIQMKSDFCEIVDAEIKSLME